MNTLEMPLKQLLSKVLAMDVEEFQQDTHLLGALPQFDSMAIMSILVELEQQFKLPVATAEISAENFQTFASLQQFVDSQCQLV